MKLAGIGIFFRKYQFFILIFIDLIFVVLYSQVILGLYQDNQSMANTVWSERSKQNLILDRSVRLTEMHSEFLENEEARSAVESSYISQGDTFVFLDLLEQIADRHSIILSLDLGDFPDDLASTSVFSVSLNISARGTYEQGMRFLQELETLPYYIQFRKIDIQTSSATTSFSEGNLSDPDDLDFLITAYTLWY